jgi:hypothetical protein
MGFGLGALQLILPLESGILGAAVCQLRIVDHAIGRNGENRRSLYRAADLGQAFESSLDRGIRNSRGSAALAMWILVNPRE